MTFTASTESSSAREMVIPGLEQLIQQEQWHQARYNIYKMLSLAFLYPGDIDWDTFIHESPGILELASDILLFDINAETAMLSSLSNSLDFEQICCEHTMLFINNPNTNPIFPYESIYQEDTIMGKCTRLIQEQYEQYGLAVDQRHSYLLPDHIALELDFMAYLIEKDIQSGSSSIHKQKKFFSDHPGQWMHQFLAELRSVATSSYFSSLATVAEIFIGYEKKIFSSLDREK